MNVLIKILIFSFFTIKNLSISINNPIQFIFLCILNISKLKEDEIIQKYALENWI